MIESVKSVSLEPGFYALRYVHCEQTHAAPHVFVACAPDSERAIQLITAPYKSLSDALVPGGCVVVRAERSGSLQLTIRSVGRDAPPEIELKLVSLEGDTGSFGGSEPAGQSAVAAPTVEVTGHVSRRGDVKASNGRWIAGPDAPAPIEGVQAQILGANGVSVEYQVLLGGQNGTWTSWMSAGAFAGTRGQFRPLLAGRFRLIGPRAAMFQLEAEALFLGSPIQTARGNSVELRSGSQVDPLVGLKIALTNAEGVQKDVASEIGVTSGQKPKGRVRVFRASGAR